jgi:hypothetical protein
MQLDYAPPTPIASPHPLVRAGEIALFTAAAVAMLWLMQKGIVAIGAYYELRSGCWQLNALRAAASATALVALLGTNRASFILFGLLYAGTLLTSHEQSLAIPLSAGLAGVGAALTYNLLSKVSSKLIAGLAAVFTFNVLMTLGSLYRQLERNDDVSVALGNYGYNLGIRVAATLMIFAVAMLVVQAVRRRQA